MRKSHLFFDGKVIYPMIVDCKMDSLKSTPTGPREEKSRRKTDSIFQVSAIGKWMDISSLPTIPPVSAVQTPSPPKTVLVPETTASGTLSSLEAGQRCACVFVCVCAWHWQGAGGDGLPLRLLFSFVPQTTSR